MLAQVLTKPEIFALEVVPLQSGEFGIFNCAKGGRIVGVTYSHTTPPASGETLAIAVQVDGVSLSGFPVTVDSTFNANTVYLLFDGSHSISGGSHVTADLTYTPGGSPAPMDGAIIQVFVYFDRPHDYFSASPLPAAHD